MDLRLRRAMGMLRLGSAVEAAEAAAEAGREAGQPPLAAVSVAARVAAAGAKSLCEGEAEEEALDELTTLKVPVTLWLPLWNTFCPAPLYGYFLFPFVVCARVSATMMFAVCRESMFAFCASPSQYFYCPCLYPARAGRCHRLVVHTS